MRNSLIEIKMKNNFLNACGHKSSSFNQNMYYLIIQNETFLLKKDGVVIQSLYIKRCNNDQLPSTPPVVCADCRLSNFLTMDHIFRYIYTCIDIVLDFLSVCFNIMTLHFFYTAKHWQRLLLA